MLPNLMMMKHTFSPVRPLMTEPHSCAEAELKNNAAHYKTKRPKRREEKTTDENEKERREEEMIKEKR